MAENLGTPGSPTWEEVTNTGLGLGMDIQAGFLEEVKIKVFKCESEMTRGGQWHSKQRILMDAGVSADSGSQLPEQSPVCQALN